jgi:hypothetical protein
MYWQYTTALASLVLAAMNPLISSADNAIENFIILASTSYLLKMSRAFGAAQF